jgi:protein-L-isoaspartate(D-aspartate) O-methyltransferase
MRTEISTAMLFSALLAMACAAQGNGASAPRGSSEDEEERFARLRARMANEQLAARGITDERVLAAMRKVRRHRFMPPEARPQAYEDSAVAIGFDQTISQPYVVAFMTQALEIRPGEKVLEIGTGSGYQAAVLAEMGAKVWSIEIICELAQRAEAALEAESYGSVRVRCGDGYKGWPEEAPFDAVVVTAAPPEVPTALVEQLKPGGRLIAPVGVAWQNLRLVRKGMDGKTTQKDVLPVRFVPMVKGKEN